MKNPQMTPSIRKFCTLVLAVLCSASALAQTAAPRKDRVFLRDVEGIWINESYMKALVQLRSPHAAAKKSAPVVIAIKREGRAFPIVVTDFNKASIQAVLDVEPDGKPGSYRLVVAPDDKPVSSNEVKYIPFQGTRNAQGGFDKLRVAEPTFMKGKWSDYVPMPGELSPSLNRIVISGAYKDEKGRTWEFTDAGEARWPDQKFIFELSLNDPTAACEYLHTEDIRDGAEKKRFGYAWKSGKLSIFPARLAGKKVACESRPLAVLTPQ
jgi:hypothetical protein